MDLSDSDDDDCQLYTRTAEHFIMKRSEMQAKRRELEKVIDLLSEDEVENVLTNETFTTQSILLEDEKSNNRNPNFQKNIEIIDNISLNSEDSEDDIPLAELRRSLMRNKRNNESSHRIQPIRPKRQRNSRRRRNKQSSSSQVRDLGVVVLDDDTGYSFDSLQPISFDRRFIQRKISDESLNISLESIINQDSEVDLIDKDDSVTLTIEWNNCQKTTRKEFKLRRYQKFESLFEELAKMENVSTNRILLMYDYKSIKPVDTPASLNLKFYGALIGSISATEVNHSKLNLDHPESESGSGSRPPGCIQVKLLLQSKQSLLFTIMKHQKMDVLYQKCAEELKCEKNKLKLTFDGEHVEPNDIASDLDIEDGDVFHVHVKL